MIYIKERRSLDASSNEVFGEALRRKYLSYIDFIAQIMDAGMEQSRLKNLDPKEMAWALLGMINSFVFQWIVNPHKTSLISKSEIIMSLFLRGAGR